VNAGARLNEVVTCTKELKCGVSLGRNILLWCFYQHLVHVKAVNQRKD